MRQAAVRFCLAPPRVFPKPQSFPQGSLCFVQLTYLIILTGSISQSKKTSSLRIFYSPARGGFTLPRHLCFCLRSSHWVILPEFLRPLLSFHRKLPSWNIKRWTQPGQYKNRQRRCRLPVLSFRFPEINYQHLATGDWRLTTDRLTLCFLPKPHLFR